MTLALVSSGRSLLRRSAPTKLDLPRSPRRRRPLRPCPLPPSARGLLERGAAHGDDLLGVLRLDRGDRVAGVDRPGEGVVALDREDVARSASRRATRRRAARCSCRSWSPARGTRRGRPSASRRSGATSSASWCSRCGGVGDMDLADAGDLRRGLGDARRRPMPATSRCTSPSLRRGGDGGERRVLDRAAVMLDQDQRLHFDHSQRLQLARPARRPSRP